jgi:UDP-glucose 4-epimerase
MEQVLAQQLPGKRVLITGGMGMIGSSLAHTLVQHQARVTIVDAFLEPYGANPYNVEDIRDQVEVNITDIRDREAMKVLVRDQDIIFNLAAQVSHNDSIHDPFLDADINYIGHLNVIENVSKYNPKARVLFSGSRLQFGRINAVPVDETHPLRPKTPYAFNKTVAENMYRFYSEVHGISCVVFRIANPYGIRSQMKHSKYSIVNFFIRRAMDDQTLTVYGSGDQLRDYVYVEDLTDAMLLAAVCDGITYEVFNVGSGTGTRFRDMVETVRAVVGKGRVEYIPWPKDYLNVETGDYITNIDKISKMVSWKPAVPIEEGIERTVNFYRKHREHYW